ncbi:MAG TPA: hypothetical protein VKC61_20945 [Pyrinomonadaceae bacterium]|nr:hypothetical protein [Pyrinomonadaceae bacterium]
MDTIFLVGLVIIVVVGALLPFRFRREASANEIEEISAPGTDGKSIKPKMPNETRLLLGGFAVLVILFGTYNVIHFWDQLKTMQNTLLFCIALFIFMVLGMLVQVAASKHQAGKSMRSISLGEVLFPLLYSIVVYYSIWAFAASGPKSFYALYAAFMNGYFWQNIVSKAKPVTPEG